MCNKAMVRGLLALAVAASAVAARGDVFSMSGTNKSLDFVAVGDAGNAADTDGLGAVGYAYRMGEYDVTSAQYCQFLNAVAASDTYSLYTTAMATTGAAGYGCGIARSGTSGSYTYSVLPGWANMPANWVSWGDAARFCNWLDNGQPTGPEGLATTETGAYTLDGDTTVLTETRNAGAKYFIPSENEWYKAAYYNPAPGPTGSIRPRATRRRSIR